MTEVTEKSFGDMAIEILEHTNDGDDLEAAQLKLVENAVNGFLNGYGETLFKGLHKQVMAGEYKPAEEQPLRIDLLRKSRILPLGTKSLKCTCIHETPEGPFEVFYEDEEYPFEQVGSGVKVFTTESEFILVPQNEFDSYFIINESPTSDVILIDPQTRNLLIQIYESLSPKNQRLFNDMPVMDLINKSWELTTPKEKKWILQPQKLEGTYKFDGALRITPGIQDALSETEISQIIEDVQNQVREMNGCDYLFVFKDKDETTIFCIDQLNEDMKAQYSVEELEEYNHWTMMFGSEY